MHQHTLTRARHQVEVGVAAAGGAARGCAARGCAARGGSSHCRSANLNGVLNAHSGRPHSAAPATGCEAPSSPPPPEGLARAKLDTSSCRRRGCPGPAQAWARTCMGFDRKRLSSPHYSGRYPPGCAVRSGRVPDVHLHTRMRTVVIRCMAMRGACGV